jgi:CheY-like chemotaxis protein
MDAAYQHYVSQLKERRPEIADFLLRCERDHLTPEDYIAMRHSMRHLGALDNARYAPQLSQLAASMRDALNEENPAIRINLLSLGRVLLAACNEVLVSQAGQTKTPDAFQPPVPLHNKPTLLSVDDDRIVCAMVEAMFGPYMHVITAPDGLQGLHMIRLHKPDLVLMDDSMPHMTGMKLLETVRAEQDIAHIAVIMLTSSDRPQDLERASAAGAADYVIKPFDPAVLAEKVYKQFVPRP